MTVLVSRHSCASARNGIESKKSGPTGRLYDSISFDARWAAGNKEILGICRLLPIVFVFITPATFPKVTRKNLADVFLRFDIYMQAIYENV
jgi:hypothetical protein